MWQALGGPEVELVYGRADVEDESSCAPPAQFPARDALADPLNVCARTEKRLSAPPLPRESRGARRALSDGLGWLCRSDGLGCLCRSDGLGWLCRSEWTGGHAARAGFRVAGEGSLWRAGTPGALDARVCVCVCVCVALLMDGSRCVPNWSNHRT